ncbi:hypothetical protein SynA1544_03007 [Synechococcus sp. A15-44]|nr:hypothetical protein SynA1544_03007 [Synechococcus sp. A15-44]
MLNPPFDGEKSTCPSMVIRVCCRRTWVSALIRSVRREVLPPSLRRRLIVVDLPKTA